MIGTEVWQEQQDDPEVRIDGRVDPAREDAYWQHAHGAQAYHRDELGYDDYAPAYCVGYIGFAQYGGRFDDAEKSLCANWIRIKGDSRLTLDEAMQAIRAAWDHAAQAELAEAQEQEQEQEQDEQLVESAMLAAHARSAQQPAYAAA